MKSLRRKHKDDPYENQDDQFESSRPQRDKPLARTSDDDLSISLRAEMLPASDIRPDLRRFRSFKLNPLKILAVLVFLSIVFLGWFLYFGPGRPSLERFLNNLLLLQQTNIISSPTVSSALTSPITSTSTRPPLPTNTRTARPMPSATATSIQITTTLEPTATESGCRDVLSITLQDLGQTICARGVIQSFEPRSTGFYIAFTSQKGAMYWVSYDMIWEPAKEGLCVEMTGEVMQIANSPVFIFGFANQPAVCTVP